MFVFSLSHRPTLIAKSIVTWRVSALYMKSAPPRKGLEPTTVVELFIAHRADHLREAYHEYLTLQLSHFEKLTSHFSIILVHFLLHFGLHSSHLRAVFPLFHFFTFESGLLSLFTLVTLNMVSPPEQVIKSLESKL